MVDIKKMAHMQDHTKYLVIIRMRKCFIINEIVVQYSLVTVLFEAVNAVRVFTSHKNIALSRPAEATCSRSFA